MPLSTLERPAPQTTSLARVPTGLPAAAALVALYVGAVLWTPGRLLDQATLMRTRQLAGEAGVRAADALLSLVSPTSVGLAVAAVLAVGVLRRRTRQTVLTAAAVPLALLAAEALKRGLLGGGDDQDVGLLPGTGSFPSGHVTVVAALALAAVRVVPTSRRRLAYLLGASVSGLVGVAVVVAGWHRPGDVAAGVLVAALVHEVVGRFGRRAALPGGPPTTTGATTR